MALNYQSKNYASDINSVYKITLDMSGWDKTTIQVQAPLAGRLYVYGTNGGGQTDYSMANAQLAQNFQKQSIKKIKLPSRYSKLA
jgi:HSP20 family molecular chaperone IbpA